MSTIPPPIPSTPPPRKGWWARHWKWAVPTGCLATVLLCAGFGAGIIAIVFGAMRSSDPYKEALTRARAQPAITAALGSPVDPGFFVTGRINLAGSSGNADLAIPIHGPKGAATLYVTATKSQGEWHYSALSAQLNGQPNRINLLHPDETPNPK